MARRRLEALNELFDSEIDFSDIPPLDEQFFENAKRGVHYRPDRQKTTTQIDADVLAWLGSEGNDAHSRLNAILREAFERDRLEAAGRKKAS